MYKIENEHKLINNLFGMGNEYVNHNQQLNPSHGKRSNNGFNVHWLTMN